MLHRWREERAIIFRLLAIFVRRLQRNYRAEIQAPTQCSLCSATTQTICWQDNRGAVALFCEDLKQRRAASPEKVAVFTYMGPANKALALSCWFLALTPQTPDRRVIALETAA